MEMKELLPYIIERIEESKARYEVHSFPSGAVMVDIFIDDKFYVIQIYGDEIGLSLITEETMLFDILPDRSFKDAVEFRDEFEKIFPKTKLVNCFDMTLEEFFGKGFELCFVTSFRDGANDSALR